MDADGRICSDLEAFPPLAPLSVEYSTHHTYLDSKGRPTVSFLYQNLTDEHIGFIYVRPLHFFYSVHSNSMVSL